MNGKMTDSLDDIIKGLTFVSVSTIKRKTGLTGHVIGNYLRDSGNWVRWSKGKTNRPVWKRKEKEQ